MAQPLNPEVFRRLCAEKGLTVTHQRQVIWEALMSMHGHPSPENIYEAVRKQIPAISLATVYKNVHTFVENGLLAEVSPHRGQTRLETNMTPHHHFVCTRCKTITDIDPEDLSPVRLKKRAPAGFRIHRYMVEVHGLCRDCTE